MDQKIYVNTELQTNRPSTTEHTLLKHQREKTQSGYS